MIVKLLCVSDNPANSGRAEERVSFGSLLTKNMLSILYMSNTKYILEAVNNYCQLKQLAAKQMIMKIETQIDKILEERKRSFYWLSKTTGISHTTLWRLKKGKALGINFVTLEKICLALECQPGDVLRLQSGETENKLSR